MICALVLSLRLTSHNYMALALSRRASRGALRTEDRHILAVQLLCIVEATEAKSTKCLTQFEANSFGICSIGEFLTSSIIDRQNTIQWYMLAFCSRLSSGTSRSYSANRDDGRGLKATKGGEARVMHSAD